jgi:hypothetical protein
MSDMDTWQRSGYCTASSCVEVQYRKATASGASSCVEVGTDGDQVLVRDSKNPGQAPLRFTADEWRAFVAGVKADEFDL